LQKNLDSDASDISSPHESDGTECRYERGTHSVNITSGHAAGYGGGPPPQQPSPSPSLNGPNRCPTPLSSGGGSVGNPNYSSFRDHIKSKATLAETFMKNLNRNNNNNSSSNNYNHLGGSNGSLNLSEAESNSFAILQANSKKMLDSARKQNKYLAKRKILMHYNSELGGEKRLKEMGDRDRYPSAEQHDDALNNNHSHAQDNIMEPIITTIVPQTPPPSTHNNNFKIRLVESHHLTNNNNNQNPNQSQSNNNSSPQSGNNNCHNDNDNDDEEALNLVQIPNANGSRNREQTPTCATPTPDIQLIKREVETELPSPEIAHNNNGHADEELTGAGYERKYDDNNNNRGLDMETD